MLEISTRKIAQVALMARELGRAEGELRAFIDRLSMDEQAEINFEDPIPTEMMSPVSS